MIVSSNYTNAAVLFKADKNEVTSFTIPAKVASMMLFVWEINKQK